jgi:hypothetical protein
MGFSILTGKWIDRPTPPTALPDAPIPDRPDLRVVQGGAAPAAPAAPPARPPSFRMTVQRGEDGKISDAVFTPIFPDAA